MKNNIFCHNCDAVISYKQEAWSKNDGESDCPVFVHQNVCVIIMTITYVLENRP